MNERFTAPEASVDPDTPTVPEWHSYGEHRETVGLVLGGRHPLTLGGLSQVLGREEGFTVLAVATTHEAMMAMTKSPIGLLRSGAVRLAPVDLRTSEQMRLTRLAPSARWKQDAGELQVPVPERTDLPTFIRQFLIELRPLETVAAAS